MAHITFAQSYGLIKPREGWERSCLDGYPWAQLKFRIYNYRVLCPSPLVIQFLNLYVTQKFPWLCFHLVPIPPSDSDSVTITRVGYLVGVPPPGMFPSSSWSDNSPAHFLCPQSSWWWQDRGRGLGRGDGCGKGRALLCLGRKFSYNSFTHFTGHTWGQRRLGSTIFSRRPCAQLKIYY